MTSELDTRPKTIIYGVFKGMGDLMAAVPMIVSELNAENEIVLLVFPQILNFVSMIDFGFQSERLRTIPVAPSLNLGKMRRFFKAAASVSPDLVWLSPHTPEPARSWKIPLFVWAAKTLCWRHAKLVGAKSERLSWLFDLSISVDRTLPFAAREWAAYTAFRPRGNSPIPPRVRFKESIGKELSGSRELDLLILPSATALNRKWPLAYYPELLRQLPPDWRVAICGVPEDMAVIKQALPVSHRVLLLEGSLAQAIWSISNSRMVFCMDSGPMFFADALGVPALAMFGASDPSNVISSGGLIVPIFEKKWPCQPCGNSRCSQKLPFCITSIDPTAVAAAVRAVLDRVGASAPEA